MVLKAKSPAATEVAATETKVAAKPAAKPAAKAAAPKFEEMDESSLATGTEDGAGSDGAETDAAETATPGVVEGKAPSSIAPVSEAEAAAETREATKPVKPVVKEKIVAEADTADASTSTEVAVAPTNALAVSKKHVGALSTLENVFDPSTLDFNTFPRVTVGLDGFSVDDGRDLGKQIGIEVMSYNDRWVCAPGDDSDEAKKLVRYSLDGKHIDAPGTDDDGRSCAEYITELKEVHGMSDAGLKKYQAIYGFMTYANDEVIDEVEREIIGLQVPPQSRALFLRHQITHGVKITRGLVADDPMVWCKQEKKAGTGTKKFALIHFFPKQQA